MFPGTPLGTEPFFFLEAKISSNFYHITVTVVARPFDKFPNEELLSLSTRSIFRAKHTHPEKKFLHRGQFRSEKKLVSIETVALQKPQIIFEFSPQEICHSFFFFYAKAPENPGSKTRARSTPGKAEQSASTLELGRILTNRGELQRRSETAIQPPRSRRRGSFVVFTHFRCGETGVCCASWLGNAALFLVWAGSV